MTPPPKWLFCIVSSRRSENVPRVQAMFPTGANLLWVVGCDEGDAYLRAGATRVVEGGKLCASRNRAIEEAKAAGCLCVQMSDDVTGIVAFGDASTQEKCSSLAEANERASAAVVRPVSPLEAATMIHAEMERAGAFLGGVYNNPNKSYAFQQPAVTTRHFIVGDFIVVNPASDLRFDERFTLKEDYDLTCQHLARHGVVVRHNRLLLRVKHRTNPGGCVAYRTADEERRNIARLKARWPGVFRDNSRRSEEVIMRWRTALFGGGGGDGPPSASDDVATTELGSAAAAAAAASRATRKQQRKRARPRGAEPVPAAAAASPRKYTRKKKQAGGGIARPPPTTWASEQGSAANLDGV